MRYLAAITYRPMLVAVCALLAACGKPDVPTPDTVFTGTFVTLDDAQAEVEALAILDSRILARGTREEMLALAGEATRHIEIPGVAVPGWVDAHVHASDFGETLEILNVEAMSKEAIVAAVAKVARSLPAGEWIVGRGWDEGFFVVRGDPAATDLDPVSPDHPVVLAGIGGHSVWVNSYALERAGITAGTPDPDGGRIVRDSQGRPTGLLLEQAEALVTAVMPDTDARAARERRIGAALDQYVRWGLTGVHDAGADLDDIAVYKDLLARGELPIRIYVMAHGDAAFAHYLRVGPEIGLGDERLTIRSFKIFVDGALGARGAELSAPYADAPSSAGLRQMSDEELDQFIAAARAKGFQVNAHAIGDLAVERMLDAIERNGIGPRDRYRVEHASIISPTDLPRFAALGAIASVQPVFLGEYSRWGEARVGLERATWILPIADLASSGAVLAAGTDYPASDSGDPRTTLNALVARTGFDGKPPGGWFPDQTVDVETALRSMSTGPAYAAFEEREFGVLAVGRYADFTVLGADPRAVPPAELLTLPVRMTVVGGAIKFGAR